MSLKLWYHPPSSFSQKVLIAFSENETPFEPHVVLRDEAADRTIPESSLEEAQPYRGLFPKEETA